MVMVDNTVISNSINISTENRVKLHNLIYNNIEYTNILQNLFSENDKFSFISYDANQKVIILKIKKSAVKKDSNYSNNIYFYYTLIDNIMACFFNLIRNIVDIPIESVRHMYDSILIGDSSIVLYL